MIEPQVSPDHQGSSSLSTQSCSSPCPFLRFLDHSYSSNISFHQVNIFPLFTESYFPLSTFYSLCVHSPVNITISLLKHKKKVSLPAHHHSILHSSPLFLFPIFLSFPYFYHPPPLSPSPYSLSSSSVFIQRATPKTHLNVLINLLSTF